MLTITLLKVTHSGRAEAKKLHPFIESCDVFAPENSYCTLAEAVDAISELKKDESYISVTCSSCCLVPLGPKDEILHNSIMVSDKRALTEAEELKDRYASHFAEKYEFLPMASYMMHKIL